MGNLPRNFGNSSNRTKPVNFWYVAAVVLPLIVLANVGWVCYFGSTHNYYLDQAGDILHNEMSTTNVSAKLMYLQQTEDALAPYSGNTGFWWPTQYSDIDAIKADIKHTIDDSQALKGDVNAMAYQQHVMNLDTTTAQLHNRIHDSAQYMGLNPITNWVGYTLLLLGIFSVPMLMMADKISYHKYCQAAKNRY